MIPITLILALILVESDGNSKAIGDNGLAYGCLQMHASYVKDANEYANTYWEHKDAFDPITSLEIMKAYMKRYANNDRLGRYATAEDIARIHNGGPNGYKKASTDAYWSKVKSKLIEFGRNDLAEGKTINIL